MKILAEIAELFFVDTTPFVEEYFTKPGDHEYDWRGVLPVKTYIANLVRVSSKFGNKIEKKNKIFTLESIIYLNRIPHYRRNTVVVAKYDL